ncbi:transaldolase family protein [Bradyrhizobium liaoningense]|uniref:transaldolase family protein n=1 Tax=Bradyrhizobium liaoningense TaxID=43992 RepID=UPI001BAA768E|nr:transaldolase family protein [Bradyrhizobium liaoningense]MBR0716510.1 hypothetical protein [Bradyrhizobium liaoningense]
MLGWGAPIAAFLFAHTARLDTPEYGDVVDEALAWGRRQSGDAAATADRPAVSVDVELLRLGSGEADANLSFNVVASVARAHQITDAYKRRGVGLERVLNKPASTWVGIRAAANLDAWVRRFQSRPAHRGRRGGAYALED